MSITIKKFFLIGFICLSATKGMTQDARTLFEHAIAAHETGNASESLSYLKQAERALGKTNAKIQSLKAMVYYDKGDFKNAGLELARYFKPSPKVSTSEYADMRALQGEIEAAIRQNHDASIDKLRAEAATELSKVETSSNKELESYHFSVARDAGTLEAIQQFIMMYPRGTLKDKASIILGERLASENRRDLLEEGDQYMLRKDPKNAISKYQFAQNIRNDEQVTMKLIEALKYNTIKSISAGDEAVYRQSWEEAIHFYKEANSKYAPQDLTAKLNAAMEEYAYEMAKNDGTPEAYEKYILQYPKGIYVKESQAASLNFYMKNARMQATVHTSDLLAKSLNGAIKFSNSVLWSHYEDQYYEILAMHAKWLTTGKKSFRIERVDEAISYYENLSQSKREYASKLNHLKRKKKAWSHDDFGYFAARTDKDLSQIGFDLGGNSNTKTAGFISVRGSLKAITNTGGEPFETKGLKHHSIFANLNLTRKIVYPVWVYGGAGYVNYIKIDEVAGTEGMGIVTKENKKGMGALNLESGLIFNLSPLTFSVGVSLPQFNSSQKSALGLKSTSVFSGGIGIRY